jgi:hypothetical protein
MNDSYAFSAAPTRGSAGVELLVVGVGVDGEPVDGDVELLEVFGVLGVVVWLPGALGPGFGKPLLHPATAAAATAAATSETKGDDLRTGPPNRGDAAVLWG